MCEGKIDQHDHIAPRVVCDIAFSQSIAMSFFGGGGGGNTSKPAGPDPVMAAKLEMEMYTDLFNTIASSCFTKCATAKHRDADLSLGEMACTDRCVSKYLETQQKVGEVLRTTQEEQLRQQQNMAEMQTKFGN
jgi:mitochondrial import inner membrane translocase subunit TIM10